MNPIAFDPATHLPLVSEIEKIVGSFVARFTIPWHVIEYGSCARAQILSSKLHQVGLPDFAILFGMAIESDLSYKSLSQNNPSLRKSKLIVKNPLAEVLCFNTDRLLKKIQQACRFHKINFKCDADEEAIHLNQYALHLNHNVTLNHERKYVFPIIRFWDESSQTIVEYVCDPLLSKEIIFPLTSIRNYFGESNSYILKAKHGQYFELVDNVLTETQQADIQKFTADKALETFTTEEYKHLLSELLNYPPQNTLGDPDTWPVKFDLKLATESISAILLLEEVIAQHQALLMVKASVQSRKLNSHWAYQQPFPIQLLEPDKKLCDHDVVIHLLQTMQTAGMVTFIDTQGNIHGLLVDKKTKINITNHKDTIAEVCNKSLCLATFDDLLEIAHTAIQSGIFIFELGQDDPFIDTALSKTPLLFSIYRKQHLLSVEDLQALVKSIRKQAAVKPIQIFTTQTGKEFKAELLPQPIMFQANQTYLRTVSYNKPKHFQLLAGFAKDYYYFNGVKSELALLDVYQGISGLCADPVFAQIQVDISQFEKSNLDEALEISWGVHFKFGCTHLKNILHMATYLRTFIRDTLEASGMILREDEIIIGEVTEFSFAIGLKKVIITSEIKQVILKEVKIYAVKKGVAYQSKEIDMITLSKSLKCLVTLYAAEPQEFPNFQQALAPVTSEIENNLGLSISSKREAFTAPAKLYEYENIQIIGDNLPENLGYGSAIQFALIWKILQQQCSLEQALSELSIDYDLASEIYYGECSFLGLNQTSSPVSDLTALPESMMADA